MFVVLYCIANVKSSKATEERQAYEHIDYVSEINQENCYICGSDEECPYWGEDNVAIINLNTFECTRIEINRYDDYGTLIEEHCGYMQRSGLYGNDTYVNALTHPDQGYSSVEITGVKYEIDRALIQSSLCQQCLDTINDMWFADDPPSEIAIISLEDRTIRPLIKSCPWFSSGNYGIDCEFEEDGNIDLLIHYCGYRY